MNATRRVARGVVTLVAAVVIVGLIFLAVGALAHPGGAVFLLSGKTAAIVLVAVGALLARRLLRDKSVSDL